MSHLTPDELVDAADAALRGERHLHGVTCAMCRTRTEQLQRLLSEVQPSNVPEPSPLFWTHFSKRVREAVDQEALPRATWRPVWLRWSVLTPVAALALVVTALVIAVPHGGSRTSVGQATVSSAQPAIGDESVDDASWRLVIDLIDDLDLDQSPQDELAVTPGLADRAVGDLRPAERDELLRLLRAELGRPGS